MLYHVSISAHEPARVAGVLARIWGGEAHPFPPVEGAFIALAGDDRGTLIEVHPFGIEMVPGTTEVAYTDNPQADSHSTSHQAIGTSLTEGEVLAIAQQEGWRALHCDRGPFEVIEVWLENRILIEVLTAEMQRQYVAAVTPANWRTFVAEQATPTPTPTPTPVSGSLLVVGKNAGAPAYGPPAQPPQTAR